MYDILGLLIFGLDFPLGVQTLVLAWSLMMMMESNYAAKGVHLVESNTEKTLKISVFGGS